MKHRSLNRSAYYAAYVNHFLLSKTEMKALCKTDGRYTDEFQKLHDTFRFLSMFLLRHDMSRSTR
jgi:hypothetical protein